MTTSVILVERETVATNTQVSWNAVVAKVVAGGVVVVTFIHIWPTTTKIHVTETHMSGNARIRGGIVVVHKTTRSTLMEYCIRILQDIPWKMVLYQHK